MAQKRLSELATYADLFERLWDIGLLLDFETYEILDANHAVERILGFNIEEVLGKSVTIWEDSSQKGALSKSLRIARRRYFPRQFDSCWVSKSGEKHVMEVSACVLKLTNGKEVIQVTASDVTQVREAKREVARYLEELKTANEKLEELSTTDEMTQISNFRHFKSELAKEHERSERYDTPYSIIFIDVDNFKHYNDRNGHPAGDQVLIQVARILKEQCRNTDLPARYGGEEFVILGPGVSWKNALVLAERVRKKIEEETFEHGEAQPLGCVSVSIGVSSCPADGASVEQILQAADEALYYSKTNGRNQVTSYNRVKGKQKTAA